MGTKVRAMSLQQWVKKIGIDEVARLLGIKTCGIYHWLNGRCLPHSRHMITIYDLSKGAVTADRIIRKYHHDLDAGLTKAIVHSPKKNATKKSATKNAAKKKATT